MTNYIYSPSTASFYPVVMKQAYIDAGTWPEDGKEVSNDVFEEFAQNPPEGKIRGDVDGMPGWVDIPPPSEEEKIASNALELEARMREATQAITIWQTKLLMGRKLTDKETASLNLWMDYIDALAQVDTSKYYPDWPEKPQ